MGTFSANVLQWIIYDAYQEDYAAQQLEKELERERKEKEKAPISRHQAVMTRKLVGKAQLSEAVQGRVLECWKVLERMVNQNTFDDIAKGLSPWVEFANLNKQFQIIDIGKTPLMNFGMKKELYCHFGNSLMTKLERIQLQI